MKETYSILGCGWLGLPLAKHFIKKDIAINGSTTSSEKLMVLEQENIKPYLINIDESAISPGFLNVTVLLIMITSKKLEAYETLISEIEKSSIEKVIFISSTSVYPSLNKECTEEDQTVASLLATVENLFRNNSNFKTTIIRFAGLYGGERQPGNWFKDKKIPHPKGFVNMIHRADCIAVISQILDDDIFEETFNACANHHPTREEYYIKAKQRLNMPAPVFDTSKPLQYKIISPAKLIKRLNYKFIFNNLLTD